MENRKTMKNIYLNTKVNEGVLFPGDLMWKIVLSKQQTKKTSLNQEVIDPSMA
jgi:hypothetical protein